MKSKPRLILASASPARLALLAQVGITAEVIVSGIDEETPSLLALNAVDLAYELALKKARAVADSVTEQNGFVLGCDSVFELDGEPLGKPGTPEVARLRLHQMSGRVGVLHTGHALINLESGVAERALTSTKVEIASMSDAEIEAYLTTGEPLHVAGSFTIDSLGGPFVVGVQGDPSNVVGLSLPTLRRLFARFNVGWERFLTPG